VRSCILGTIRRCSEPDLSRHSDSVRVISPPHQSCQFFRLTRFCVILYNVCVNTEHHIEYRILHIFASHMEFWRGRGPPCSRRVKVQWDTRELHSSPPISTSGRSLTSDVLKTKQNSRQNACSHMLVTVQKINGHLISRVMHFMHSTKSNFFQFHNSRGPQARTGDQN